jgi:hypothetical protein
LPRKSQESEEEELASFQHRCKVSPALCTARRNESWTDEDTRAFLESDTTRKHPASQTIRATAFVAALKSTARYREKKLLMQKDLPPIPRGRPRSDADVWRISATKGGRQELATDPELLKENPAMPSKARRFAS